MEIKVVKRDGSKEPLNINKIHQVLEWACEGLKNVSISDIEINSQLQFHNNIKSEDIHHILIRSASDLISLTAPDYQFVAARLLLFNLRKDIWKDIKAPSFYQFTKALVKKGVYSKKLLEFYTREDFAHYESLIDQDRDYNFTFAGLQQMVDKYLLKDRSNGRVWETPQFAYMLMAMTIFRNYEGEKRKQYVHKMYDAISLDKINLPTPQLCGLRTPIEQFASCTLIDVGDSLPSIFHSNTAIGYYTARRAGIGLNVGRIRAVGSSIRGGEVVHTGLIPYIKMFQATCRSTTQNGVRGGSATIYFQFWHKEVKDLLVLKNNKGNDENRARHCDYAIQLNRLFYKRLKHNEDISLFTTSETPGLYEAFISGDNEAFEKLYCEYENSNVSRNIIKASELLNLIVSERISTGRIYIMNMDHVNTHSSFNIPISMSNLCVEVTLPTSPIEDINSDVGEVALCVIAGHNLSKVDKKEFPELCDLTVRAMDEIIDIQEYPLIAAKKAMFRRRNIGVGLMSIAHYLAKHQAKYNTARAVELVDEVCEAFQYHLLDASCNLAQEKGRCEAFTDTKYSQGFLPIDHYAKNVDKICTRELALDWEALRAKIKQHGLRNSTLTCNMPGESSTVKSNSTNSIEPPKGLLSVKSSKMGNVKMILPDCEKLKKHYTLAYELPDAEFNKAYTHIAAVMQKFFDQSISFNQYYDYKQYENSSLPLSVVVKDLLYAYSLGIKTLYYANSNDENVQIGLGEQPDKQVEQSVDADGCESGACTL